jgi:hypothetical protein
LPIIKTHQTAGYPPLHSKISDDEPMMRTIEILALLSTAILFGGMILYSFGFAPLVFQTLTSKDAGRLIRLAFPWYYLFTVAIAALGGVLLIFSNPQSAALMAGVMVIGIYARQVLMRQINEARDRQLSGEIAAHRRFGMLHGTSVALNFAQISIAGYVLSEFLNIK